MTWDNRGQGQPCRDRYGWGDNVRGASSRYVQPGRGYQGGAALVMDRPSRGDTLGGAVNPRVGLLWGVLGYY